MQIETSDHTVTQILMWIELITQMIKQTAFSRGWWLEKT